MSVYRRPISMEEAMRRGLRQAAEQAARANAGRSDARRYGSPLWAQAGREQGNDVVDMIEHNGVWMVPEDARR